MRYILALILAIALGGKTWASSADTAMNNFTANGNFYKKTGFNAGDFDGVDDNIYIQNNVTANLLSGSTAFSVEAWVYPQTYGDSTTPRIIDKIGAITRGYYLYLNQSAVKYQFAFVLDSGTKTAENATVALNSWTHVVGVWSGVDAVVYSNGSPGTIVSATGSPLDDTANAFYIGNRQTEDRSFDGYIRRVRVFKNKALTQDEVTTLYNGGIYVMDQASPVSGVTAEYNFTDGSGTTLTDSSGNSATGTLKSSTEPQWIGLSN